MTPEEIRAEVFNTWDHIHWESPSLEIENLTPYAECLIYPFLSPKAESSKY